MTKIIGCSLCVSIIDSLNDLKIFFKHKYRDKVKDLWQTNGRKNKIKLDFSDNFK